MNKKTLFDKIWEQHIVEKIKESGETLLYVDIHYLHEVTSPQAFDGLRQRDIKVRRPEKTFATVDHAIPSVDRCIRLDVAKKEVNALRSNAQEFGISLFDMKDRHHGIVHIIGPELGLSQPGRLIVCGDSHTSTHGAFGAIAFGIGTSEVEMVLASQCLLQKKPENFEIRVDGKLASGADAKDIILEIIRLNGVSGGVGYVFEFTGDVIRSLNMEERMTICNMAIEGGAKAGLIAPDRETFEYLRGKPFAPKKDEWEREILEWNRFKTDEGAFYNKTLRIDGSKIKPMVTYGTNPGMSIPITGSIPDTSDFSDEKERAMLKKSLTYMGLSAGEKIEGKPIDYVFIGSCTNGRITDLRKAAKILQGKKIAPGVTVWIVPGSEQVKREAEKEGLAQIFIDSGCEWRYPSCSACLAMNGEDVIPAGKYCASTSNRNFEGRQGKGSRTFLVSPMMAAAAALTGKITDVRNIL